MKKLILLALLQILLPFSVLFGQPHPNVLFIIADDLTKTLPCYGYPLAQTPNVDRLAARAVRFDRAYCQYPVCSPSRTSLMSGRRPEHTGMFGNSGDSRTPLLKDAVFRPEHFKANGYFTARLGKVFHIGSDVPECWDVTEEGSPGTKIVYQPQEVEKLGLASFVSASHRLKGGKDQAITLETRVRLTAGKYPVRVINSVPGPNPSGRQSRHSGTPNAFTTMKSRVPWQLKLTDDDFKPIEPTLIMDWLELDGPLVDSWPTAAHERIFFSKDAREIIAKFAERAWPRPVQAAEVAQRLLPFEQSRKLGESFEQSVRGSPLAVLCSDSFLYLEQGDSQKTRQQLSDWELASRLSYFLWSTMPDDKLLALARSGTLHEPATPRSEVKRLLADAKSAEFARAFPRQWLQLRKVGMFAPDKGLFPTYDENLEGSTIAETVGFFGEVLRRNGSLREFLDSDWTMLNERLAEHYGISGIRGDALQRVALKPEHHRGGILVIVLGLRTDMTRVVTYMNGSEGNGLPIPEIDITGTRHNLSHHNGDPVILERLAKSDAFIMKQFAHFLDELRAVKDGDAALLDSTMVLFGSGMSYGHSNSNSNLPILLAGGKGLGFKHGQHIDYNNPHLKTAYTLSYDEWKALCGKPKDEKARLSNVMLTMLQKMEVNEEKFVDCLGPVSEIV